MNMCSLLVKYSPQKMQTPRKSNICTINMKLLPIKAHYFFLFGGLAGTFSFFPLMAKDLGFNATAVGVIYTLMPFFNFLSKFIFGYVTDFFRNIKYIMIILAVVTTTSAMLILFIPALGTETSVMKVKALCFNNFSHLFVKSADAHSICLPQQEKNIQCFLTSTVCFNNRHTKSIPGELSEVVNSRSSLFNETRGNNLLRFCVNQSEKSWSQNECDCLENKFSLLECSLYSACYNASKDINSTSVYLTYNFWMILLLLIVSGCGVAAFFCLSDATCYEVLGEQAMLYGRQRLWGTISWGIVTLATGYLIDVATGDSLRTNYSPGFYMMLAFMTIDLVILYRLHVVKTKVSMNIFKDVGEIFASYKTIVFTITAYICGGFSGLLWHYQFWYLQDLGASQTLLGLVTAVQCLVTEVPFFFFSGWLIENLKHFNCMLVVLMAFALRMGLYALLVNPWLVLPIELLHGITYALFFSTLTDFAAKHALPGTEVTTLGVLEGFFEGLGVATGSLLGGLGFDHIGGRLTFCAASIISLISVPVLSIACIFIRRISIEGQTDLIKSPNFRDYGSENCGVVNGRK